MSQGPAHPATSCQWAYQARFDYPRFSDNDASTTAPAARYLRERRAVDGVDIYQSEYVSAR